MDVNGSPTVSFWNIATQREAGLIFNLDIEYVFT